MSENEKKFDIQDIEIDKKELKSKDTTRKIISILSALAFVIAAGFLVIELPDYFSQKNFNKAVAYEEEYNFETAVTYYSKIKKSDKKNFSAASEKIAQLNGYIDRNKYIASAVQSAKTTGLASFNGLDEITDIKVSLDGGNVSFVISGTGYIVSGYEPPENKYYTVSHDEAAGLYVSKYAPEASLNSVISALAQKVKTEASNFMFKEETSDYSSLDVFPELIKQYVK